MFLRWLLTTFPKEMREGWRLVQPDLLLWIGLASLVATAAMMLPPPGSEPPPPLPFLVAITCGLLTSMLPAVLFTAQVESRELTWTPVLGLLARKALPFIGYAVVAMAIAYGTDSLMMAAVSLALGDNPLLLPGTTVAGVAILVSILVRYSFLPFLVILQERPRIPEKLWSWRTNAAMAGAFWPLTASARLTEGRRWRLVFYTLLGQVLPLVTALVDAPARFPLSVVAMVALTTAQAVVFHHYRQACAEAGASRPTLPFEEEEDAQLI